MLTQCGAIEVHVYAATRGFSIAFVVNVAFGYNLCYFSFISEQSKWSLQSTFDNRALFNIKTAFTRCRHILKTVKNSTDRPPVHTKTAHFLPADFENGRF